MRMPLALLAATLAISACADHDQSPTTLLKPGPIATQEGCSVWDLHPRTQETVDWTGACVGGLAEGQGEMTWHSQQSGVDAARAVVITTEIYTGAVHQGRYDGDGSLEDFDIKTGKSRSLQTGHFVDFKLEGHVTASGANGFRFSGTEHDGQMSGIGAARFPNGAVYAGMFGEGLVSGHGVLTGQKSIRFPGGFGGDQAHGSHRVTSSDGYRFEGEFDRGRPEGHGRLVLFGLAPSTRPSWTVEGEWVGGCLSDGDRQACIGPREARMPELAVLPPTHPAIAKSWAGRVVFPADAAEWGLTGEVTLGCSITAAGVAEHCDVTASPHQELDVAAIRFAMSIPWIPAAQNGVVVASLHTPLAVGFGTGEAPLP